MRVFALFFLLLCAFTTTSLAAQKPIRFYHDSLCGVFTVDTLMIPNHQSPNSLIKALEIRAKLNKHSKSSSIIWGVENKNQYYFATLSNCQTLDPVTADPHRGLQLIIGKHTNQQPDSIIYTGIIDNESKRDFNETSLAVDIDCTNGITEISAGKNELKLICQTTTPVESAILPMGVLTAGEIEIPLIVSEYLPINPLFQKKQLTSEEIDLKLSEITNFTSPEGMWEYLDRDCTPDLCQPGGTYRLAILKNQSDGYDIIYLSGAKIKATQWRAGEIKGQLSPTQFINHYNLTWLDAAKQPIETENSASMENSDVMRLDFPLLKSSVRLKRIR